MAGSQKYGFPTFLEAASRYDFSLSRVGDLGADRQQAGRNGLTASALLAII